MSNGYMVARFRVVGKDVPAPVVDENDHQKMASQVYENGTDRPLLMKYNTKYFDVYPFARVPSGVLALPESVKDGLPRDKPILIAKEEAARKLRMILA